ncbi:MAG TPA: sulfotransferase domain-containing protein [Candidatus Competibacteraceae bacterium]|nr:sulfotransferase domain-containing protein [Candidatus Competibacteraceae bacterium]
MIERSEQLPQVTNVYQNHHMDSTRWDAYSPRDDDIVISTSIKSGTTWAQVIVRELIVQGLDRPDADLPERIPLPDKASSFWLDATFSRELGALYEQLEAQEHRRFIKTHLPLDGLPFYPQVKYLVIGRDARDVFMSLWNHYANYKDDFYQRINEAPDLVGEPCPRCPEDIHVFWQSWISQGWFDWEQEGYPFWGNMHHAQTWWNYRHLDNIQFFHYADLLANPTSEIKRIADFLGIGVSDKAISAIVRYTNLSAMRQRSLEAGGAHPILKGGANTFFFKGMNGRWRDILSDDELAMYEATKSQVLSLACARWLEQGRAAWHASD